VKEALLFLKKKKQKNFWPLRADLARQLAKTARSGAKAFWFPGRDAIF
jgi:hypothetical protein